jgi:lipopolysaccharide transport system ATP-binding protein
MNDLVLQVENLGKTYFQYRSEVARILSWFGLAAKPAVQHCVLQGVSFSVGPGEAVGIVGQNGAGKSTLLKIVTGTQMPTTGRVQVNGRIGSILELGMGFNPEFTGRQNAYHSAGLMGFSESEIESVMVDIENFAEVGEYFDQPVNTYSSGMQMRVAFSVVTAFRPALLIVDEALSVGDTYFQHKSFGRIREFQEKGSSLLLVSHDRSAIQSLCDRAILLDHGKVIHDDTPSVVMDYYNALVAEKENATVKVKQLAGGNVQTISGTGEATVGSIALFNDKDEPVEFVNVGDAVSLKIQVKIHEDLPVLVLGYMIKDRLGQTMYGTNTWHTEQISKDLVQGDTVTYHIRFPMNLGPGTYSVSTALVSTETHLANNYEWKDLAYVFEVANLDKVKFAGSAWLHPVIEINR